MKDPHLQTAPDRASWTLGVPRPPDSSRPRSEDHPNVGGLSARIEFKGTRHIRSYEELPEAPGGETEDDA